MLQPSFLFEVGVVRSMSVHCGSLSFGGPHNILSYVERVFFLIQKQQTFSASNQAKLIVSRQKKKRKKQKKLKQAKQKTNRKERTQCNSQNQVNLTNLGRT